MTRTRRKLGAAIAAMAVVAVGDDPSGRRLRRRM